MLWAQDRVGRELVAQLGTLLIALIILFVTAQISTTVLVWGSLGLCDRSVCADDPCISKDYRCLMVDLPPLNRRQHAAVDSDRRGVVLGAEHILSLANASATLRLGIDMCVGNWCALSSRVPGSAASAFLPRCAGSLIAWRARVPLPIRPLMKRFSPLYAAGHGGCWRSYLDPHGAVNGFGELRRKLRTPCRRMGKGIGPLRLCVKS